MNFLLADNPAANLVFQTGLSVGQNYLQSKEHLLPQWLETLRFYFKVNNAYLLAKLKVLLFPFGRSFRRMRSSDVTDDLDMPSFDETPAAAASPTFLPACSDVNAADLYIPTMAFATYIVLSALALGLLPEEHSGGTFSPDFLFANTSRALFVYIFEVVVLLIVSHVASMADVSALDAVAFLGYKSVVHAASRAGLCEAQSMRHMPDTVSCTFVCPAWRGASSGGSTPSPLTSQGTSHRHGCVC